MKVKAIVEFKKDRSATNGIYFNVSGNSIGRIQSIVDQYREHSGLKFSHIWYDRQQDGLSQLTNYKGTSYIKC